MSAVFVNVASEVLHLTALHAEPIRTITVRLEASPKNKNRARAEPRYRVVVALDWAPDPWAQGVAVVDLRGHSVEWTFAQVGAWLARSLSGERCAVMVEIADATAVPAKWTHARSEALRDKVRALNDAQITADAVAKLQALTLWAASPRKTEQVALAHNLMAAAATLRACKAVEDGEPLGDGGSAPAPAPAPSPAPAPTPSPPPPPAPTPPPPSPPGGDNGGLGAFGPMPFEPGTRGGRFADLEGVEGVGAFQVAHGTNSSGYDAYFVAFPVRIGQGRGMLFSDTVVRRSTEAELRDWVQAGMPVAGQPVRALWDGMPESAAGELFCAVVYDKNGQAVCASVDGVYVEIPTADMALYSLTRVAISDVNARWFGVLETPSEGVNPDTGTVAALNYFGRVMPGDWYEVWEYTVSPSYDAEVYLYRVEVPESVPTFARGVVGP